MYMASSSRMMDSLALGIISCLLVTNAVTVGGDQRRFLGETVFDITKYGAKGDGKTDDAMVCLES